MKILVVDYCANASRALDSYAKNSRFGFISYAASSKFDQSPALMKTSYSSNSKNISKLSDAKNFFLIINAQNFTSKMDFINKTRALNHDVFIISPTFLRTPFTSSELNCLKTKPNGGRRTVLCHMPIGEVRNSSLYWQTAWKPWSGVVGAANKKNPGIFNAKYWLKEWHDIVYGSNKSETFKLLTAGCDGALL